MRRVSPRTPFLALVAALAVLLALGCGGPRGGGRSRSAAPAPAPEEDLAALLPLDAPLTAAARPGELVALLGELTARNVALQASLSRSDVGFLLDPAFFPALGLDAGKPAWFSVRAGPVAAVLQVAEDLARVLQAPEQLDRWLADRTLPAAWSHVRLVGQRKGPSAPETWLGDRYGAVQVLDAGEPAEMWAAAFEIAPERAAALVAALAPLGQPRVCLLLEARRPTAVVLSGAPPRLVVDWVQDAGLGAGGLVEGLLALAAPPAGRESAEGPERVAGAPAKGEALRLAITHGPWIRWARATAEVEVVERTLAGLRDGGTSVEARGAEMAQARRAAALPETLLGPGALLFRATRLSLRRAGDSLLLDVEAPYTSRAARLGELGDGQAPLSSRSVTGAGVAAVTVAASARHARVMDEVAPHPPLPLDRFLGEVLGCGFVCWPALWAAIPSYARQPVAALGTVFPEVAAFAEPMTGAMGAVFVVESQPKPALALAVRYGHGLAEVQARWRAAVPSFEQRPIAAGPEPVLVLGNAPSGLDLLARAVGGAAVPALALVDGDFAGPVGTIFGRFGVRLVLAKDALQLQSRWTLLPLAPPPQPAE